MMSVIRAPTSAAKEAGPQFAWKIRCAWSRSSGTSSGASSLVSRSKIENLGRSGGGSTLDHCREAHPIVKHVSFGLRFEDGMTHPLSRPVKPSQRTTVLIRPSAPRRGSPPKSSCTEKPRIIHRPIYDAIEHLAADAYAPAA